ASRPSITAAWALSASISTARRGCSSTGARGTAAWLMAGSSASVRADYATASVAVRRKDDGMALAVGQRAQAVFTVHRQHAVADRRQGLRLGNLLDEGRVLQIEVQAHTARFGAGLVHDQAQAQVAHHFQMNG